jgi:glutaredoxin-like YruB-family protein
MPEKKKPKVKVYSTPTCPYCNATKEFLKENKIEYDDIDVSKDREAAQEMIEKSGQMGVPVIDINGTIIVGYDRDALKKALKIK